MPLTCRFADKQDDGHVAIEGSDVVVSAVMSDDVEILRQSDEKLWRTTLFEFDDDGEGKGLTILMVAVRFKFMKICDVCNILQVKFNAINCVRYLTSLPDYPVNLKSSTCPRYADNAFSLAITRLATAKKQITEVQWLIRFYDISRYFQMEVALHLARLPIVDLDVMAFEYDGPNQKAIWVVYKQTNNCPRK